MNAQRRGRTVFRRRACLLALASVLVCPLASPAAGHPDELYRMGRYAEAEEAYGRLDMDRPKDLRYRYNRGCAAFQNGDDQAALAAFTSVLRRAEDDEMRFRAAFNLGTVAYRQGDFAGAVEWFRQVVAARPHDEDARANLELSLRQLEKQKEEQEKGDGDEEDSRDGQSGEEGGEEGAPRPDGQPGESQEGSEEKPSGDEQPGQGEGQTKGEGQEGEEGKQDEGSGQDSRTGSKPQPEEPRDLSGELAVSGEAGEPAEEGVPQEGEVTVLSIDREKAEALLDNIREDRSRFLQFHVPDEKKRGVESGKEW